jgi:hypothetical protein
MSAKAIEMLVQEGYPITEENIRLQVNKLLIPLIKSKAGNLKKVMGVMKILDGLRIDQAYRFAHHLNLKNFYLVDFIDYYLTNIGFVLTPHAITSRYLEPIEYLMGPGGTCLEMYDCYSFYNMDHILEEVKKNPAPVVSMVAVVPVTWGNWGMEAHAVLFTVVKRPNQKPLIVYLDSNNLPINAGNPYAHGVKRFVQLMDGSLTNIGASIGGLMRLNQPTVKFL